MLTPDKIGEIQSQLRHYGFDGWLLFDHHGSNKFARELLGIPALSVLTRRFFYWIPSKGEPLKIVHRIEEGSLDYLPGTTQSYLSWIELEELLRKCLEKTKKIAMEYSSRGAMPDVSVVDAGTMEIIAEYAGSIASSADLLQNFTSILTEAQMQTHRDAIAVIFRTLEKTWDFITLSIRKEEKVTEFDVQQFILSEFAAKNCISEESPICAVNEHSSFPHYIATKKSAKIILPGDFILVDLWCKKDLPDAIYADITRVAIAAPEPTPRHEEIFNIVKKAQLAGIDFIARGLASKKPVLGKDVDDVCRKVITDAGYGAYFTHRTGHNIGTSVHGSGAHLDNLETSDNRTILPSTCFSIEPGIYLPNAFGVRLECNVIVTKDLQLEVTGKAEEQILCLL